MKTKFLVEVVFNKRELWQVETQPEKLQELQNKFPELEIKYFEIN